MRVQNTNAGDVFGAAGCSGKPVTPGGLKAAAGARRVVSSSPMLRAMRDGESLATRGRSGGFASEHAAWMGLPHPPSALPGNNAINAAKKRQISIDGPQT